MLTFVGLGLYDLTDIPLKGYACIRDAEYIFFEAYTSRLAGCSVAEMAEFYGHDIRILSREDIEVDPEFLLAVSKDHRVALLTGGDPMISTTHIDLRIRAKKRGIETHIIHASSISTAVCGLTGLQNYRFGKTCSLPYPYKTWSPLTPFDVIRENRERDLHTLVYLDLREDRCMTIPEAVEILEEMAAEMWKHYPALCWCGQSRIGNTGSYGRKCRKDQGHGVWSTAAYSRNPGLFARYGTGISGVVCRPMMLHECRMALEKRISRIESIPPPGCVLFSCAREIFGMVDAYYHDGMIFLTHGDLPNALASLAMPWVGWMPESVWDYSHLQRVQGSP